MLSSSRGCAGWRVTDWDDVLIKLGVVRTNFGVVVEYWTELGAVFAVGSLFEDILESKMVVVVYWSMGSLTVVEYIDNLVVESVVLMSFIVNS